MMRPIRFLALAAVLSLVTRSTLVHATPYASGITVSGTSVAYILNEDADSLTFTDNGTPVTYTAANSDPQVLKGSHTVTLGLAADTFSFAADRTENGFTQPDGGTLAAAGNGLGFTTNTGYGTLISTLTNPLTKFNSPRGISVSKDPNATNFGTAYISNSAAGSVGGRTLTGRGLYAVKADQTDAFGYGDAAQQSALFGTASTNTPYKVTVAANGEVYAAGFGDALSGVWRMPANLASNTQLLGGTTGPGTTTNAACLPTTGGTSCLPVGQNHGSVLATYVTGSTATSDLTVYTLDEDMTTAQLTRAAAGDPKGTDTNKLWQYNIGGATLPYTAMPTAITPSTPFIPGFSIILDVDRGADGKWYLSQNRAQPATVASLFVTDSSGTVLFDSYTESHNVLFPPAVPADFNANEVVDAGDYVLWRKGSGTLANEVTNPGTFEDQDYTDWRARYGNRYGELYSNVFAIAVSPDQKWLAALHNNNTISVTPLINGIPDVANALTIPTGITTASARDIAWDAAGNLHMVSSGQGQYLVIAPGGHTIATTSWNGTSYAFNVTTVAGSGSLGGGSVPEPGTLLLALAGVIWASVGRWRR